MVLILKRLLVTSVEQHVTARVRRRLHALLKTALFILKLLHFQLQGADRLTYRRLVIKLFGRHCRRRYRVIIGVDILLSAAMIAEICRLLQVWLLLFQDEVPFGGLARHVRR